MPNKMLAVHTIAGALMLLLTLAFGIAWHVRYDLPGVDWYWFAGAILLIQGASWLTSRFIGGSRG